MVRGAISGRRRSPNGCDPGAGGATHDTARARAISSTSTISWRIALSSICSDCATNQAFNVGGADIVTWNEYFDRFSQAMGLPPLEVRSARLTKAKSIAAGAVRTAAQLLIARHRRTLQDLNERGGWVSAGMTGIKRWVNTNPSSAELEHLYSRTAIYDWSKAERLLDYRPAFDLDRGLRLSVEWLRYAGLLN